MLIGFLASRERRVLGSFVVAAVLAACGSSTETPKADAATGANDASGDGGGSADDDVCAGTTSNAAGAGDAWTAMPLVDDTSNPARPVTHIAADIVTGLYFETADKGFVATADDGLLNPRGGAVFLATGSAVTSVAFSGDDTGIRHLGTIDFVGIDRTPAGYIATAYASEVIASSDGGATFQLVSNAGDGRFGIDRTLAIQVTASGTTMVGNNGVISASTSAPGPSASYDDVWTSSSSHSECPDGPRSPSTPTTRYAAYVSPDRNFLAYAATPGSVPSVCISTDAGRSFRARSLGVTGVTAAPSGVVFMTKKRGIAWYGSTATGAAYIKRTADGGATWTTAALPGALATSAVELQGGFAGSDCMHLWLAGYDGTAGKALLLASTDGGATWAPVAGVADAVDAAHGSKLYSVFAIDTAHIWLGGSQGVIVHN